MKKRQSIMDDRLSPEEASVSLPRRASYACFSSYHDFTSCALFPPWSLGLAVAGITPLFGESQSVGFLPFSRLLTFSPQSCDLPFSNFVSPPQHSLGSPFPPLGDAVGFSLSPQLWYGFSAFISVCACCLTYRFSSTQVRWLRNSTPLFFSPFFFSPAPISLLVPKQIVFLPRDPAS